MHFPRALVLRYSEKDVDNTAETHSTSINTEHSASIAESIANDCNNGIEDQPATKINSDKDDNHEEKMRCLVLGHMR